MALSASVTAGCTADPDPDPVDLPPPAVSTSPGPDSEPESGPDSGPDSGPGSAADPRRGAPDIPEALRRRAVGPSTPSQAAAELAAAERLIRQPATSPRVLRLAGRVQQLAYRELGARPGWDNRVLAALPARLRPVVRANVAARRELHSLQPAPSATLPAWRIVRPAPPRVLLRFYRRAESQYGVGWEYLAAINLVETGMGRIRGLSTAGARGPMQFLPATWAAYGEGDIDDPADAIPAAARYLAANGFTRPGGIPGALFRYNNSAAYVRGVTLLARVMERWPRALFGYYQWRVYYATTEGDVLLPDGYAAEHPIPVGQYLARRRP